MHDCFGCRVYYEWSNHLSKAVSAYPFGIFGNDWSNAMDGKLYPNKGNTVIGNDVWIGYKAAILPGITIGDGAIIGSYSIVTQDVAPYTIVGGNPAMVIRKRFDDQIISKLLEISWWNWPIEKITKYVTLLTGNISGFLNAVCSEDLSK